MKTQVHPDDENPTNEDATAKSEGTSIPDARPRTPEPRKPVTPPTPDPVVSAAAPSRQVDRIYFPYSVYLLNDFAIYPGATKLNPHQIPLSTCIATAYYGILPVD